MVITVVMLLYYTDDSITMEWQYIAVVKCFIAIAQGDKSHWAFPFS